MYNNFPRFLKQTGGTFTYFSIQIFLVLANTPPHSTEHSCHPDLVGTLTMCQVSPDREKFKRLSWYFSPDSNLVVFVFLNALNRLHPSIISQTLSRECSCMAKIGELPFINIVGCGQLKGVWLIKRSMITQNISGTTCSWCLCRSPPQTTWQLCMMY